MSQHMGFYMYRIVEQQRLGGDRESDSPEHSLRAYKTYVCR